MKSSIKNIIKDGVFLPSNGNENNEYQIPIYQRHYDWETEHIINLYTDIGEAVEIKKPHYTGSFLLTKQKKYIVIDGQQRMISTFILLKGFQLNCVSKEVKDKINQIFFTDPSHPYGDSLRLTVSAQDKILFESIIYAKKVDSIPKNDTKLYKNFKLGYDYFKKLKEKYSEEDILKYGFEGLQICELIIEDDVDDEAQKIFRDLNSKGQSLKNSDLIRNFLLMTREDLYYGHWQNIELMFTVGGEFQSELFEDFIFNYVLLKNDEKTNENKIFNSYVSYCEDRFGEFADENGEFDRELAVTDLAKYANIYKLFLNVNVTESDRTKYSDTIKLLSELRDMKQTTSYPFLMRVVMDEINGVINLDILNKVINLVVVYYVRAVVCNISSGSRRGYLLTMYKNIFGNVPSNKNESIYYQAIYKYFHEVGSGSRMPTEDKFLECLKTFDLYSNKPVCRQVLKTIVNNRFPNEFHEKITVDKPTIEHLLPQTPTDKWERELNGKKNLKAAMEYVDTLGNLSLAYGGKNSELGNKSKNEKIEILQKYSSSLHELNKDFIELKDKKFTLDFIKQREKRLSLILQKCYQIEPVNTNGIYFDNYDVFTGTTVWSEVFKMRTPTYVEIEGNTIQTKSFYDVQFEMLSYFARNYKEKLEKVAENSPLYSSHPIITKERSKNSGQVPGVEVFFRYEGGGSCFFASCRIAEALGISMNQIRLMIRKQLVDPKTLVVEKVEPLDDMAGVDLFKLERKSDGLLATAYFKDGKMIVVSGSNINKENKPYFNKCFVDLREKLRTDGFVDENYKFICDCCFASPSAASNAILGYNSNGKKEWRRVTDNVALGDINK